MKGRLGLCVALLVLGFSFACGAMETPVNPDPACGIGAVLAGDSSVGATIADHLEVRHVLPGNPAAHDLRPGDQIIQIDGHRVAGMNLGDAVQLIRGPAGTKVGLTIKRAAAGIVTVTIVRAPVQLQGWRVDRASGK